jgi:hypothetical protein
MEPFRFHVFVCDRQKPEGVPCRAARGSGQVLEALRREVNARGLGLMWSGTAPKHGSSRGGRFHFLRKCSPL